MADGIVLDLDVRGIKDALAKLDVNQYNRVVRRGITTAMVIVEREAKIETPVDTGALRQGYRTVFPLSTRGYEAVLKNVREYAVWVHEGTSRGIKGNPFMDRARDNSYNKVIKWFTNSLNALYNWSI